jgi:hypothetical protein
MHHEDKGAKVAHHDVVTTGLHVMACPTLVCVQNGGQVPFPPCLLPLLTHEQSRTHEHRAVWHPFHPLPCHPTPIFMPSECGKV